MFLSFQFSICISYTDIFIFQGFNFIFHVGMQLRLFTTARTFQPAWSHPCVGEKNDFVDEDSADFDEKNDDDRYWDCKMQS